MSSFDADRFEVKLAGVLDRLGIEANDCLMVHTAAGDLLRNSGASPDRVIETLIRYLGPNGTLLIPTINFDWCDGKAFDVRHTPSQMGVVTEAARKDPRFSRTGHAIYSFAVAGKLTEEIVAYDHPGSYGIGSPFHHLHRQDGKILVIGMPWKYAVTFFHYVEEMNNVPYRFHKSFKGEYTSADGLTQQREYFMFARDIGRGVVTDVGHVESEFVNRGLATRVDDLGTYFTSVRAATFYDEVTSRLNTDPGYLHRIE